MAYQKATEIKAESMKIVEEKQKANQPAPTTTETAPAPSSEPTQSDAPVSNANTSENVVTTEATQPETKQDQ